MDIPVYDFPNSPILLIGFLGIFVALATLFITYKKYFNSPLNRDKKFAKNSLEIEFKKVSSQLSWDETVFNWTLLKINQRAMSPLGEFLILVIAFTSLTLFYSIKQFEESKSP